MWQWVFRSIPSWEFWASWPALLGLIVVMGLGMIGSYQRKKWWFIGFALLGALGLYSGALFEEQRTKPDRDYVYFTVPPTTSQNFVGGKLQMWGNSTGPLNHVKACALRTIDYAFNNPFKCAFFDTGEGNQPTLGDAIFLEMDNWTIDIDGRTRAQMVRQWIKINEIPKGPQSLCHPR
jgi:hypothetical protein